MGLKPEPYPLILNGIKRCMLTNSAVKYISLALLVRTAALWGSAAINGGGCSARITPKCQIPPHTKDICPLQSAALSSVSIVLL